MYRLKDLIGEDVVNRALRTITREFAYAGPPYPTTYDLEDALRAEMPADRSIFLEDWFDHLTQLNLQTTSASARKLPNGKYEITLQVQARKTQRIVPGRARPAPLDEWVDLGAFALPANGRPFGKNLYLQQIHLTGETGSYTFTVDEMPALAGIDPFALSLGNAAHLEPVTFNRSLK